MRIFHYMAVLACAIDLSSVAAAITPLNSNLEIRNAPGAPSADTLATFRRLISAAVIKREADTVFKNSTSLDTSWDGVVLFSVSGDAESKSGNTSLSAGVEIVCTTCYIKGLATAQLTTAQSFNLTQAFDNVTAEITGEIGNFSTAVVDYVRDNIGNATTNLEDGLDINDFDFPPIKVDFDIDAPDIPECELQFQFDGMEMYMQVDTILSSGATYTLNLYTSKTAIGVAVGHNLLIGVVFTIDLILSVESEIDISSGFHIKLNDGIAINIPMFDHNVSSITFNGGNFEFLPVTIKSAGVILTGLLRVGLKAGLEISTEISDLSILEFTDVSTGIEVGVWVDVAQFKTNVTAAPATNGNSCELLVIEEYVLALGANVGASLAIGHHTWGPVPETSIPIFYTTLAEACAISKSATAVASATTPAPARGRRDDQEVTTTVTEVTYTATQCLSTGLINCPVSLQTTSKTKVSKTLTATIKSGSEAVFLTENTVVSTIAFGTNMLEMSATSGSPLSYVPLPTNKGGSGDGDGDGNGNGTFIKGNTGGVSNKIIIGVSVGVGVPVLIATVACLVYCFKRKIGASTKNASPTYYDRQGLQVHEQPSPAFPTSDKKSPNITVIQQHS